MNLPPITLGPTSFRSSASGCLTTVQGFTFKADGELRVPVHHFRECSYKNGASVGLAGAGYVAQTGGFPRQRLLTWLNQSTPQFDSGGATVVFGCARKARAAQTRCRRPLACARPRLTAATLAESSLRRATNPVVISVEFSSEVWGCLAGIGRYRRRY